MTARAMPSILSKGFIWFLFCFQIGHKSVLFVKSVVKIRNHPLVFCSPGRIYSALFCRLSYYCYLTAKLDYYKSHRQYPVCTPVPGGQYARG